MAPAPQSGSLVELFEAAQTCSERGEHVKALKMYNQLVEYDPPHEAGCLGKVVTLQHLNRPRGALKACLVALSYFAANEQLLALRDELWATLGDEEAEEVYADLFPVKAEDESQTDCGQDSEGEFADCQSCTSEDDESNDCPASRSVARVQRETRALGRNPVEEPQPLRMDNEESAPYRIAKKERFIKVYRDFYAKTRTSSLDTSQYTKEEKKGLSIQGGHRPMPRPDDVELPDGHQQPVGTLSPAELAQFGCNNSSRRLLVSLHGDIFDVSDRPDKYGPDGPYAFMTGHDLTWALWSGYDEDGELDKYFDLLRAAPQEERERRFQGLMSWWCFFEQEYGAPVGRLSIYEREWELPSPPQVEDLCVVM